MNTYFTIDELCYSDTANRNGIDNTPNEEQISNLKRLITFLNPIRECWDSPILVNSGFRCKELNNIVGGVSNSAHLTGNAADLYPKNNRFDDFVEFLSIYLQAEMFDQCIIESSKNNRWVHLGLFNNENEQRRQLFELNTFISTSI